MVRFQGVVVALVAWTVAVGCGDSGAGKVPEGGSGTGGSHAGSAGGPGSGGSKATAGSSGQAMGGDAPDPCDCDDGIDCTLDECVDGECRHLPRHFQCTAGKFCSAEDGCLVGDACAADEDCKRPDNCVTATCDTASARCRFAPLDSDLDGHAPESCGGDDCDDDDAEIHGGHAEWCDGKDNDCDDVTDPPEASACAEGLLCENENCICPDAGLRCDGGVGQGLVCYDGNTDDEHCGSCTNACTETEECKKGSCECAAGFDDCSGACVDFQTDAGNCGDCGVYCGNAECNDGNCECPGDTLDCSLSNIPACVPTESDVNNCGDCGEACLPAGACQQGGCDTSITWLKIFHGQISQGFYGRGFGSMDTDAAGNVYIATTADTAAYEEYPNGDTTLFTGPGVIAKFDKDGALKWAKNSTRGVWQIAVVGSAVWVSVYEPLTSSVTVAGHTFNVQPNHAALTGVVKLDAATGDVTDTLQLDYATTTTWSDPFLLHDASHVWLAQSQKSFPELEGTTWTPPGTALFNAFVYELGAANEPVWLPGILSMATTDGAGRLVLDLTEEADSTVNLGGDDLVFGASGGSALVRLNTQLEHDISFVGGAWMLEGAGSLLLLGGYGADMLSQSSNTGQVTSLIPHSDGFYPYLGKAVPGVVAMHGYTTGGKQLAGREMPYSADGFVTYSDTTFMLERALAFWPNGLGGTYGGILNFTLVDGGKSAVLLVRVHNGLTLDGKQYDIGYGYHGVALIKVKLYDP